MAMASTRSLTGAFAANIGFSVELLDLDGDGDLDAAGDGLSATRIYMNDGAGFFHTQRANAPVGGCVG